VTRVTVRFRKGQKWLAVILSEVDPSMTTSDALDELQREIDDKRKELLRIEESEHERLVKIEDDDFVDDAEMEHDDDFETLIDIEPSTPRPRFVDGAEMEETSSMHRSVSVADAMSTTEWGDFDNRAVSTAIDNFRWRPSTPELFSPGLPAQSVYAPAFSESAPQQVAAFVQLSQPYNSFYSSFPQEYNHNEHQLQNYFQHDPMPGEQPVQYGASDSQIVAGPPPPQLTGVGQV
jgi:hypothetical protein